MHRRPRWQSIFTTANGAWLDDYEPEEVCDGVHLGMYGLLPTGLWGGRLDREMGVGAMTTVTGARRIEVYGTRVLVSESGDNLHKPSRWLSEVEVAEYLRGLLALVEVDPC